MATQNNKALETIFPKTKKEIDAWAKNFADKIHYIDELGDYKKNWTLPFVQHEKMKDYF